MDRIGRSRFEFEVDLPTDHRAGDLIRAPDALRLARPTRRASYSTVFDQRVHFTIEIRDTQRASLFFYAGIRLMQIHSLTDENERQRRAKGEFVNAKTTTPAGTPAKQLPRGMTWIFFSQLPMDVTEESFQAFLAKQEIHVPTSQISIRNYNSNSCAKVAISNDVVALLINWAINGAKMGERDVVGSVWRQG